MIIKREIFEIKEIEKEMRKVKRLVLSRMNINRYYRSKLTDTDFVIHTIKDENTNGLMKVNLLLDISDKLKGFEIDLNINVSDPVEWIRLVIAHELYHLLFAVNAVVKFGYCITDGSYSVTTIQRSYNENGTDKIYGRQMEENLCWMLAFDTCKEINKNKDYVGDIYDKFCEFERNNLVPIREIVNVFSVVKSVDISKIRFDESFNSIPVNTFYYCMSSDNMPSIVIMFDDVFGNGAWRNLMDLVDDYYDNQNEVSRCKIEEILTKCNGAFNVVRRIS